MLMRSVIVALLLAAAAAFETETSKPGAFNKEELEAILKKDHSDRVSNIFDSDNNIQYTWNVEMQELCVGVDGRCEKEEL